LINWHKNATNPAIITELRSKKFLAKLHGYKNLNSQHKFIMTPTLPFLFYENLLLIGNSLMAINEKSMKLKQRVGPLVLTRIRMKALVIDPTNNF
jgi:hypothetical protein